MTLNVSRGLERFEGRLSDRSVRFQEELNKLDTLDQAFGLRFTALPVGEDVRIDHVFHQGMPIEGISVPWCTVTLSDRHSTRPLDLAVSEFPPKHWRPILRGARADLHPDRYTHKPVYIGYQEVHCDGLIELGFASCQPYFPWDLPLVLFANLLVRGNQIRSTLATPMAEYGLEVEIYQRGNSIRMGVSPNDPTRHYLSSLNERTEQLNSQYPEISNMKFPRYSLESEDASPAAKLLAIFWQDFQHWLGRYDAGDAVFVIAEQ